MSFVTICDQNFVNNNVCPQAFHQIQNKIENSDQKCCEKCLKIKIRNRYLMEENKSLKEFNDKLNEEDERRQEYDIERQEFIVRLLKTIKKLQLRSSRVVSQELDSERLTSNNQMMTSRERTHPELNNCTKSGPSKDKSSLERALEENAVLIKDLDEMKTNFDNLILEIIQKESQKLEVLRTEESDRRLPMSWDQNYFLKRIRRLTAENEILNRICNKYAKKWQKLGELCSESDLFHNKLDLKHSSSLTVFDKRFKENMKTNSLPNEFRLKRRK